MNKGLKLAVALAASSILLTHTANAQYQFPQTMNRHTPGTAVAPRARPVQRTPSRPASTNSRANRAQSMADSSARRQKARYSRGGHQTWNRQSRGANYPPVYPGRDANLPQPGVDYYTNYGYGGGYGYGYGPNGYGPTNNYYYNNSYRSQNGTGNATVQNQVRNR